MKRHPALRDLSDDHHLGLVHAHRLLKAAAPDSADRPMTIDRFLSFWESHMSLHFQAEEDALLPVALRHGFDAAGSPVDQMLVQHARIRGLVMDLQESHGAGGAKGDTLRTLGALIDEHIRLEERVIFPDIENALSEASLSEIELLVRRIEAPIHAAACDAGAAPTQE